MDIPGSLAARRFEPRHPDFRDVVGLRRPRIARGRNELRRQCREPRQAWRQAPGSRPAPLQKVFCALCELNNAPSAVKGAYAHRSDLTGRALPDALARAGVAIVNDLGAGSVRGAPTLHRAFGGLTAPERQSSRPRPCPSRPCGTNCATPSE